MPATPDAQFLDQYTSQATTTQDIGESSSGAKRRAVTMEDDDQGGYELPEADDYYMDEEDEEGRFFGGGLTDEQSRLLDLVDEYDTEEVSLKKEERYTHNYTQGKKKEKNK